MSVAPMTHGPMKFSVVPLRCAYSRQNRYRRFLTRTGVSPDMQTTLLRSFAELELRWNRHPTRCDRTYFFNVRVVHSFFLETIFGQQTDAPLKDSKRTQVQNMYIQEILQPKEAQTAILGY